jgi:8-oxo-dGTP pyrophosphatase MutT (NUDIX family)
MIFVRKNGKWTIPGGHLEKRDINQEAAAHREIREEIKDSNGKALPIQIVWTLGTFLNNGKNFEIFLFRMNEDVADDDHYYFEKGDEGQPIWLSFEEACSDPHMDALARAALEKYKRFMEVLPEIQQSLSDYEKGDLANEGKGGWKWTRFFRRIPRQAGLVS